MDKPVNLSKIWLVTGDRQAGKTTLCQEWVELARRAGWTTAGVLSLGEFEGDLKTAIQVEDLRTGERRLLASRKAAACQGPMLGTWQFCEATLAWADECLQDASPCDLLVVDELGPLEFERGEGWQSGFTAIEAGVYRQALVVIRPEYLQAARQRWEGARVLRVFR
jgi:nucleoside-triphosphatase THEP1